MVSTEECCLKWEQEQKIPRKNYGIEDGWNPSILMTLMMELVVVVL
jgi:hypothetical protein